MSEVAIFAGGCFWCGVGTYNHLPGVISVVSGYTGGHTLNPTYEDVITETTGHKEAIQIVFDPQVIPYEKLLDTYWHDIDPFDSGGQFCDRGDSYKTVIYYTNDSQKAKAEASKKGIQTHFNKEVATEILKAVTFYPAEDYHQDYAEKNPLRYSLYRAGCGRDKKLKEIWSKDNKD